MQRFEFPRRLDPTQPYAPLAAHDHDVTRDFFGDTGPWTWLLAETWQQAASPDLFAGPPRQPEVPYEGAAGHYDAVAYWAPLVSLLHYGLGWRRPDLGLWRWKSGEAVDDDPVLTTLDRRYGSDLDLMMAWLARPGFSLAPAHQATAPKEVPPDMKRYCDQIRETEAYRAGLGTDGDSHHLSMHVEMPPTRSSAVPLTANGVTLGGDYVDVVVVSDRFHDVFATLKDGTISPQTKGRSTRVAVLWSAAGWLGTFRRSRDTGLWFRGRHSVHVLGNTIDTQVGPFPSEL